MGLHTLTIARAAQMLKSGQITSVELTKAVLERIEAVEGRVKAFITTCPEKALKMAHEADRKIANGDSGPLTGIPLAVKDLFCTRDLPTTCSSRILEGFVPPYDALVVEKIVEAGAVIVGKTNMDEFAMGSTTEHSAFFPTKNPWDLSRVPGGSSGGSAAAVAADMCLGALGTDTGGSIRQPASHCSVVGLKPTYGRVSRYGMVAFASSLDQAGPLTKTVEDAAILLQAIAGHDKRDSTCINEPVPDYTAFLAGDIKGLKIGLPKEFFDIEGVDPEVAMAVEKAIETIKSLGAKTVEVELPRLRHAIAAYYIIAPAEASSNLARYDGVRYGLSSREGSSLLELFCNSRSAGFGPEVQRRILIGTYALSAGYYEAYFGKAGQVRTLLVEDFANAFSKCDVLASPVAPTPAFALNEKVDNPLTMYLADIFTIAANLAGICGISVPCGFGKGGLPIGLQIMGGHFAEPSILKVAHAFEQNSDFSGRRPKL
ncbi:MAG: Asp-tRNA(Asn)/Glu-tRNA(Gln) amidotransferase subunit GatA [Desulfatibacillaceae bacterium]|nr:Asp-tRNA(Asn)/Glu-tRNA(Gln) amidotransferase subunit GatA [Desulfatibacillaceae bacterium]